MPFRAASDTCGSILSTGSDPRRRRPRQRRVSDAVSPSGLPVSARSSREYLDTRAGVRPDAADSGRVAGDNAAGAAGSKDVPQDDSDSAGESVRFICRNGGDISAPATCTRTASSAVRASGKTLRRADSSAGGCPYLRDERIALYELLQARHRPVL